jgi:hypothetical protein
MAARDYLTPDELARSRDEFDELYKDVLGRTSVEPTALDRWYADQVAGSLWKIKRAGADASAVYQQVVLRRVYAESRANALVDADARSRITAIHRRHLEGLVHTMDVLKDSMRGEPPAVLKVVKGGKR